MKKTNAVCTDLAGICKNCRNAVSIFIFWALTSGAVIALHAQVPIFESLKTIEQIVDQNGPFVRGYRSSISGETIVYHSANEYIKDALLVRTTDGNSCIEWTSETVPEVAGDSVQTFVWMAGLAGSKGVHRFDLFIDGRPTFSFVSAPDTIQKVFTYHGRSDEQLTFVVTTVDQFDDLFGYVFLRMPARLLKPGAPLTMKVVGAAENSTAWFMIFQYGLKPKIRVQTLPLLVSYGDSAHQLIKVGIEHYGSPAAYIVSIVPGIKLAKYVQWGVTTFMLPVPAVSRPEEKEIFMESAGNMSRQKVVLKPVRKRTLYLLPHSHTDIGYSDYQATIEKNHIKYVDEAIDLAEKTSSYPWGARFKWNIEVLWPLESYMNQATQSQKERFIDAVKKGWIGLNGLYANLLTGLCRPEELIHATDYARVIERRYGIAVNTAMITDIPAYTSSTVTALSVGGIKYFSSGPNYMPSTSDGGDRIGFALKTWGDKPFYWQSQSKQYKVLFWMAGRGYSWFHGLNMGKLRTASLSTICEYLDELEKRDYPYDMVQVRYTVGGDNGPPDPELSDCVREWNEQYLSPKMVIATSEEMFEEFERKYGSVLPAYEGDFTPYWEDGATSSAREVAMNRNAAEKLVQAQALDAIIDPMRYDSSAFYSAWRDIVLFDEHTWGAANSISEPDSPGVKAQWEYKKAFVLEGGRKAGKLLENAESSLQNRVTGTALDVINTESWPRTDLVLIPENVSQSRNIVWDSKGNTLLSQRLKTGELAVLVKELPPFGALRLFLKRGATVKPISKFGIGINRLSNGKLSLALDQITGAIKSLVWKGMELVDTMSGAGLNQYFYVPGRDSRSALTDLMTDISVQERGPLVASLLVESAPAGTRAFRREIRLVDELDRIDIIDTIDKKGKRNKEAVHIGFPFSVPHGVVSTDGGWEVIRPESDQLPGSCKDYYSVQHWVDISNGTLGVTWTNPDAPLVEVGQMTNEAPNQDGHRVWRTLVLSAQNIYSYAMNNYWHTNYRADQEGKVILRYSIMPHKGFDAAQSERLGIEQSQPLLVVPASVSKNPPKSLFTLVPTSVLVTSLKPSDDGKGLVVRLYNPGQDSVLTSIRWNKGKVKMYVSNVLEERKQEITAPIPLPEFGVATIRIERK